MWRDARCRGHEAAPVYGNLDCETVALLERFFEREAIYR
jgi:hypothetical protein